MNTRKRFLATMRFEPLDRPLYWEFGYWVPTVRRWYREGLPRVAGVPDHLGDDETMAGELQGVDWRSPHCDVDVNAALGFDEHLYRIPINNVYCPGFEERLLEEHEEWYVATDIDGVTCRVSKLNGSRSFLAFPVKTRADYERLREERLQPNLSARLPDDWSQVREHLRARTFPLMYGGMQGFFNSPRRLLGLERLMYMLHDDPQLIRDIIDDAVELLIALYASVLTDIGGDFGVISEDMCHRGGCFVSPAMFREFMLPAYRRMTAFYRDHGIDKRKLAAGRAAIDEELERKVPLVFEGSGFVPFTDHTVPPDVSWDNFRYYRRRLAELAVG